MKALLTSILILFTICHATAIAGDYHPAVTRYLLDADFQPDRAWITGRATIFFAPETDFRRTATGYLHGELTVDSITVADQLIEFDQRKVLYEYDYSLVATEIRFPLEQATESEGVTVYYQGQFNPSSVSSPSNYMRIDGDGVFLRSYGYSLWFPIFLPARQNGYPITFERVMIRTPADFHSVFVGTKVDEYTVDNRRVTKWTAENTSVFAAQCTAQRYQLMSEEGYSLYHYSDSSSIGMAGNILNLARSLNARFKKYYRQGTERGQFYIIEMPKYGDISSGNVTGISRGIWHSFRDKIRAQKGLAHELVHPYVEFRPDRTDPLFCIAVEGFPSYFHLPVLAEILGDQWYSEYLHNIEKEYLEKRRTGRGWRGRTLPTEKPLLAITPEDLPKYKDMFVIDDRILLFLNYLYVKMGRDGFFAFTKELFNQPKLSELSFRALIERHLPGSAEAVELWLATAEYPERLMVKNLSAGN